MLIKIFNFIYFQFLCDIIIRLISSSILQIIMFVCPTIQELRFYGCCHPCCFLISQIMLNTLVTVGLSAGVEGKKAERIKVKKQELADKTFTMPASVFAKAA